MLNEDKPVERTHFCERNACAWRGRRARLRQHPGREEGGCENLVLWRDDGVRGEAGWCNRDGERACTSEDRCLKEVGYWTPSEAGSGKEVLEHSIRLGAGPVVRELAILYSEMERKATLRGRSVLAKLVQEAVKMAEEGIAKLGVDFKMDLAVRKFSRSEKRVTVTLGDGMEVGGTEPLDCNGKECKEARHGT